MGNEAIESRFEGIIDEPAVDAPTGSAFLY
jgi:hypothetical protein